MCIWVVLDWLVGIFKPWWWMVVKLLKNRTSLFAVFRQNTNLLLRYSISLHCPEHHLGMKMQIQAFTLPCLLHRSYLMQIKGDWLGSWMYWPTWHSGRAKNLALQRAPYKLKTFNVLKLKQRESVLPMKSCMPLLWSCTLSCWRERSPPKTTNQSVCPAISLVFAWATMAMSSQMIHH